MTPETPDEFELLPHIIRRLRAPRRQELLVRDDGETLTAAGQALLAQIERELAGETMQDMARWLRLLHQLRREHNEEGDGAA